MTVYVVTEREVRGDAWRVLAVFRDEGSAARLVQLGEQHGVEAVDMVLGFLGVFPADQRLPLGGECWAWDYCAAEVAL